MDAERDRTDPADLAALPREMPPPRDLEAQTVAALRSARLLDRGWRQRVTILRLAAAVVLFVGGVILGRVTTLADRPDEDRVPQYILLLHGGPTGLSDEEEAAVVREYGQWAIGLRREGRSVTGERLGDASASVPPLDRPAPDLRGYFVISAASLEDAVAVARRCPHARRGGQVIVRPIDPT
jgi:hypothetical protein